MLQFLYKDYRMSNQRQTKKAVIISLTRGVTKTEYPDFCEQLQQEITKNLDSYIFCIKNPGDLNAYTLKLMCAFTNTSIKKTGLLVKDPAHKIYESLNLDNLFVVSNNIKTILKDLEKSGSGEE
jgi:hypothetical protein